MHLQMAPGREEVAVELEGRAVAVAVVAARGVEAEWVVGACHPDACADLAVARA